MMEPAETPMQDGRQDGGSTGDGDTAVAKKRAADSSPAVDGAEHISKKPAIEPPVDNAMPMVQEPTPSGAAAAAAPPTAEPSGAAACPRCVEWAPAPPLYTNQSDKKEDPGSAQAAEEYVAELVAKWKGIRSSGDGVTACKCGCGSQSYLATTAPWWQRASETYRVRRSFSPLRISSCTRRPFSSGCAQAAYAEAAGKKDPHAHITAYKTTRKAFPEPKGHHFGAIPGIAPGQELLSKAHAAAINVHRAIYKGISVRKEKGAWSPVESISISGGYLDDEDGGETICARMPFVQASRPQPPPFL